MNSTEQSSFIQPFYQVYWIRWSSNAKPDWDTFIRSITPEHFLAVLRKHPFDLLDAVFIHQMACGPVDKETYCIENFYRIRKTEKEYAMQQGECRLAKYDGVETETWETFKEFSVDNLEEIAQTIYSKFINDVC